MLYKYQNKRVNVTRGYFTLFFGKFPVVTLY